MRVANCFGYLEEELFGMNTLKRFSTWLPNWTLFERTEQRAAHSKLRVMLFIAVPVLLIAACSRPPEIIGVDNPAKPASSVSEATRHTIFIASTREASETVGALYSDKRALDLGFASVSVSIPPNHLVGELERPKRLPPDPSTEFAVVDPIIYSNENLFVRSLNAELAKRPRGSREILFFVHGYNNTTSDSVLRLAQFVEDSGYKGIPVLFDWASAAKLTKYVYDLNSTLVARPQFEEIGRVLARTNAEGYDIFAHSMGTFLTMETFVLESAKGNVNRSSRLRNVILASPDIDVDVFRTQLGLLVDRPDNLFVLLSEDDSALRVSRRVAGGVPRLGASHAEDLSDLGVVVIDLSEIDDSSSGSHSKFAGSPEVVQLLGNGLNDNGHFGTNEKATHLGDVLGSVPIKVYVE